MAKSTDIVKRKGPGRPVEIGAGATEFVGLRLPSKLLEQIDSWAATQQEIEGRSQAIRALLERGLGGAPRAAKPPGSKTRAKAKASALAGEAIDRIADQSVPAEDRAKRKRRLLKGPEEFRDLRNSPKAKG